MNMEDLMIDKRNAPSKPGKRARDRAVVEGLTTEMLNNIRGSMNSADTPELVMDVVKSETGNRVLWWNVLSSNKDKTYKVEVSIPPKFSESLVEMQVSCDCPDAKARRTFRRRLCKHSYACLRTVVDTELMEKLELEKLEKVRSEQQVEQSLRIAQERIRQDQDRKFPGERRRLEEGFIALGPEQLHSRLLGKLASTFESVELLGKLFPAQDLPVPQSMFCYRCNNRYYSNYPSTCKMEHSPNTVSKLNRIFYCRRCSKSWKPNPEYEEGGLCFEGDHEPDREKALIEDWQ